MAMQRNSSPKTMLASIVVAFKYLLAPFSPFNPVTSYFFRIPDAAKRLGLAFEKMGSRLNLLFARQRRSSQRCFSFFTVQFPAIFTGACLRTTPALWRRIVRQQFATFKAPSFDFAFGAHPRAKGMGFEWFSAKTTLALKCIQRRGTGSPFQLSPCSTTFATATYDYASGVVKGFRTIFANAVEHVNR